ncbi:MAG: hypothetical protein M3460_01890 [Actinomycetota bacterium]|nr:hypothetical protein [Actinomycetota bacterium]
MPRLMERVGYDFPFADPASGLTPFGEPGEYDGSVRANWKVLMENGSECYHCPTVHPESVGATLHTELEFQLNTRGKFGVVAGLPLKKEWRARFPGGKRGSQYGFALYAVWPNSFIISGYFGEFILRYEPTGPNTVRFLSRGYGRPDLPVEPLHELLGILAATNAEDIEIAERVQHGLDSGYYDPGPVLTEPEAIVHAYCSSAPSSWKLWALFP